MIQRLEIATLIILMSLTLAFGCRREEHVEGEQIADSPPSVVAVCYPLEFLTRRIAGDCVEVRCAVPAGEDGSSWRPGREDILRLQDADMIVCNGRGAEYATWMTMASIPDSRLCESAARGLSLRDYIAVEDVKVVHSHGPEGEHSHPTMVANTWLDPAIAEKQAKFITQELVRVFPEYEREFMENFSKLRNELNSLSSSLDGLKELEATVILTNPKLKFLTRAAHLQDRYLNWSEPPSLEQAALELKKMRGGESTETASDDSGAVILLSSFPLPEPLAGYLAKQDIDLVEIDPLDVQPESGDYISVMTENIERLSRALGIQ